MIVELFDQRDIPDRFVGYYVGYYNVVSGDVVCEVCNLSTSISAFAVDEYYGDVVVTQQESGENWLWYLSSNLGFLCGPACRELEQEFPLP